MNDTGRGKAPPEETGEEPKTPLERIEDVKKAVQMSKDLGLAIETISKLETLVRFAEKYITSRNPKLKGIAERIETHFESFQKDLEKMSQNPPKDSEEWKVKKAKVGNYAVSAENLFQAIKESVGEKDFQVEDFNDLMGGR